MKIREGYVSNSSSSSFVVSPEMAAQILRDERKRKLEKIQKIIKNDDNIMENENNILSLYEEFILEIKNY